MGHTLRGEDIGTSIDFEVINFVFTQRDTNKQELILLHLSFFSWVISREERCNHGLDFKV